MVINSARRLGTYCYGKNPAGYHYSSTSDLVPLNQWAHLVISWDDSYVRGYINTKKVIEVACTGTTTWEGQQAVGQYWGGSVKIPGKMSDFRIYATGLSETDIKDLYQSSASIDNSGNLLTYQINES